MPSISTVSGMVPPALIIVGLSYLCYRAESLHHIRLRLIRIFVSRRDLTNEKVNQQILDESSLLAFRFSTGVKAETLADAESVISFALSKNIPLSLIGRAGRAFNIPELSIREKLVPRTWQCPILFIIAFSFFIPSTLFATLSTENNFMTSLKETGTKIWLTADHVSQRNGLFKGERTIEKNVLCTPAGPSDVTVIPTWPSARDREILCELFSEPELSNLINEEVKAQRRTSIYLAVLLGGMSVFVFVLMMQGFAAQNLAQRLARTSLADQRPVTPKQRKLCIHLSVFARRRTTEH